MKIDTSQRSARLSTTRVVTIVGLLIGTAEVAAVVSIASWSIISWLSQISWFILAGLFLGVGLVWVYGQSYGFSKHLDLAERSPDNHLTWLCIHWIYGIVGLVNAFAIMSVLAIVSFRGPPLTLLSEVWIFYSGGTVLIANSYMYILFKLVV